MCERARARGCMLGSGGRCDIFKECRCDCVSGGVGVVSAVNEEAVEGSNLSNYSALNRSQKRCSMLLYVLLTFLVLNSLPELFVVEFD